MALAFFVGFYPFPAGLMIYWITNNLLQLLQQLLVEYKRGRVTSNISTPPDRTG
jgi:membrane protein insertase Oxa1/YidC/SpoIIIJ